MAADKRSYFPGEKEGSLAARMVQLIREYGFNQELKVDEGVITKINPIEVTLADGLVLEDEDFFTLPERLKVHTEWHNGLPVTVDPRLSVGDCVIGIMDEFTGNYMIVDRIKSEAD